MVVVGVVVLVAMPAAFSGLRVHAYVSSTPAAATGGAPRAITGSADLFDASIPHRIAVSFDDRDFQRMLKAFFEDGTKEYIKADITIDGTRIRDVGLRLKGNSTLQDLSRTRGKATGADATAGGGRPGSGGRTLSTERPERLPWLVRFDEFVDGVRYQGRREIALRAGDTTTVLNEALSLQIARSVGQVAPGFSYTDLTVNGGPAATRLVVEHLDQPFAERLTGTGVLYEATVTSSFTYEGQDPLGYRDDFEQINFKGSRDHQPVIDLIRWVTTSSDREFEEQLDEHLDVRAFARYLALQNLLLNFDDISGPGNNYYLWYDLRRARFTVLGWDYNLAFRGDATIGSDGNPVADDGGGSSGGLVGAAPKPAPNAGAATGGHPLKERFLRTARYKELYERAYRDLFASIYRYGRALAMLDGICTRLRGLASYDAAQVSGEKASLRALLVRRATALGGSGLVDR